MPLNSKKKLCIVTTSRADYGLLRPVIRQVQTSEVLELCLIVSGTHLLKSMGLTINEIEKDNFSIAATLDLFNENEEGFYSHAVSIGRGTEKFASLYNSLKPDLLLVLGDRFELMSIVVPAYVMGIPIVHLCGGDLTFGAIDESIRHAVTKLATFHFVSNTLSEQRVLQLGEDRKNVFNTGHTALDNLKEFSLLSKENLKRFLSIEFAKKNVLVTFHSVTYAADLGLTTLDNLINVLGHLKNTNIFISRPNIDSGNHLLNKAIDTFQEKHNHVWVFDSLGTHKYFSLMQYVDMVVGNSSSALMETPYFKIPSVNIGDRQQGRPQGNSIINCVEDIKSIETAIDQAFRFKADTFTNPYGNGNASKKVVAILESLMQHPIQRKKKFVESKHAV